MDQVEAFGEFMKRARERGVEDNGFIAMGAMSILHGWPVSQQVYDKCKELLYGEEDIPRGSRGE